MKSFMWCGLLLALWAGSAGAASAPIVAPVVASPNCATPPNCPFVQNDSTHWFYGFDPTTNASVQSLLSALNAGITVNIGTLNGISTSALQTTGNGYLSTLATASASQATGAKQDTGNASAATIATNTGTTATNTGAISTSTGAPADAAYAGSGSSSIIAALKGIYAKLAGTLTVTTATSSSQVTLTISPVPLTSTSATLIASNSSRRSLQFMNIGAGDVTICTATPCVFGAGDIIASGGSNRQGGAEGYQVKVPTNAFYAITATGTTSTVSVSEGN